MKHFVVKLWWAQTDACLLEILAEIFPFWDKFWWVGYGDTGAEFWGIWKKNLLRLKVGHEYNEVYPLRRWKPARYQSTSQWRQHSHFSTTWTQEMIWLICNDLDYETAKKITLNERFPFFEWVSRNDSSSWSSCDVPHTNLVSQWFTWFISCVTFQINTRGADTSVRSVSGSIYTCMSRWRRNFWPRTRSSGRRSSSKWSRCRAINSSRKCPDKDLSRRICRSSYCRRA